MPASFIAAGELDKRIRIERDGKPVHDGYQNTPGEPYTLATVWARWRPAPGRERRAAAEDAATLPGTFRIRWTDQLDPDRGGEVPGINPRDRIRYPATDDGRLYEITSAVAMGRCDAIDVMAIARVDR